MSNCFHKYEHVRFRKTVYFYEFIRTMLSFLVMVWIATREYVLLAAVAAADWLAAWIATANSCRYATSTFWLLAYSCRIFLARSSFQPIRAAMLQARSSCLPIRAAFLTHDLVSSQFVPLCYKHVLDACLFVPLCYALHCIALRCAALYCLYKSPGFIDIFFLDLRGLTKSVDLSDAKFPQVPKFY